MAISDYCQMNKSTMYKADIFDMDGLPLDSDSGVRAAHAAGMFVIQVPDLVKPTSELQKLGHRIENSLSDICINATLGR